MRTRFWKTPLAFIVVFGLLAVPAASEAGQRARVSPWPGAITATLLWLIASALFSWYVSSFGSYNETYGSVAALAVLMMWFWLSAFAVLIGGEVNVEREQPRREP
jgi:membrane protein